MEQFLALQELTSGAKEIQFAKNTRDKINGVLDQVEGVSLLIRNSALGKSLEGFNIFSTAEEQARIDKFWRLKNAKDFAKKQLNIGDPVDDTTLYSLDGDEDTVGVDSSRPGLSIDTDNILDNVSSRVNKALNSQPKPQAPEEIPLDTFSQEQQEDTDADMTRVAGDNVTEDLSNAMNRSGASFNSFTEMRPPQDPINVNSSESNLFSSTVDEMQNLRDNARASIEAGRNWISNTVSNVQNSVSDAQSQFNASVEALRTNIAQSSQMAMNTAQTAENTASEAGTSIVDTAKNFATNAIKNIAEGGGEALAKEGGIGTAVTNEIPGVGELFDVGFALYSLGESIYDAFHPQKPEVISQTEQVGI